MTETIKELHPVARKPHRCDWCGGIIEKGEQYVRHTLKYENEPPYDWCSHKDCDEIVGVLDMSQVCADNDGISADDFSEIVSDAYYWLIEDKEPQPQRDLHEKVKYVLEHQDELKK